MCRRLLTYLLLSALLLTQWVFANRCMGGCGMVGHDSKPHVHLHAGVPVKADNSGCGCKRQRLALPTVVNKTLLTTSAATDGATPTEPTLPGGDGVLYLSLDLGLAHRLVVGEGDVQPDPDQLAGLVESRLELNRHRIGRKAFTLPSSPPSASRPLYLLTHSLLI